MKNKKDNTFKNMMAHPAKHVNYYDFDDKQDIECPICGWVGKAEGNMEYYDQLYDITCPSCDKMLYVVSYPTVEETKEAAKQGKQSALYELPHAMYREKYHIEFEGKKLKSTDQLPNLPGLKLNFVFDVVEVFDLKDGRLSDLYTVVLRDSKEIWREPGIYECWWRFNEIKKLLQVKYGKRFHSLKPTSDCGLYLYGDDLSSPNKIDL